MSRFYECYILSFRMFNMDYELGPAKNFDTYMYGFF